MNRDRTTTVLFLILCAAHTAFAERVWSDVPIPRDRRILCALVTITPVILLAAGLTALVVRIWSKFSTKRLLILGVVLTALTAWAAVGSSWDEMNDEGWSPCVDGSFYAALVPGLTLIILDSRMRVALRTLLAIVVISASWVPVLLLTESWQAWGQSLGLPTTW